MKKQLILTISFLLACLLVLGMASYAWFSNNTEVAASGMQISVELPINIMASLTKPHRSDGSVKSLDGYKNLFDFGEAGEDGEYDMLVPVSSADGINFLYLPFRYVGENGCPDPRVTNGDYMPIPEGRNLGYYMDIPMYLLTTTPLDLTVYVSGVEISGPSGEEPVFTAVRCAVLVKEDVGYKSLILAKDAGALPLNDGERDYLPLRADGTEAETDIAQTDGAYTYFPPPSSNAFTLRSSEPDGDEGPTYHNAEIRIRVWVEGTDNAAQYENAGKYFTVKLTLSVYESKTPG